MSLPAGTNYDLATITNPSNALTNFTLIVDLANCSASFKAAWNTNSNGYGRAAKADGTELACDWIDINYSAGTGLVRVKWSGTLANSGTQQIRLYPPNTDNAQYAHNDTYGSDNAYDSYWQAYFPNGGGNDRTVNARNGTAQGGVSVGGATGKIGKATNFDGSNDYVSASYTPAANTNYTMFIWAKADQVRQQWMFGANILSSGWGFGCYDANGVFRSYSGDGASRAIGNNNDCTTNWQHWVSRYAYSSGIDLVYCNGANLTLASNNSTTPITSATEIWIAGMVDGYWTYFDGLLQEVQIHSTSRSTDWIAEEYAQTNNNSSFWGTWAWQGGGGSYTLAIDSGSLSLSGIVVVLKNARKLSIDSGARTLSGTTVNLKATRKLATASGGLTLSGTAITLKSTRKLAIDSGAIALSGTPIALKSARKLATTSGSLSLSGTAVALSATRKLATAASALSLSGTAIDLKATRKLGINSGAIALSGSDISLKTIRKLVIDSGSLVLSGSIIDLLKGSELKLSIESGNLVISGSDIGLKVSRKLAADTGAINLSGTAINLLKGSALTLIADSGSIILSGVTLGLRVARKLNAESMALILTGSNVGLLSSIIEYVRIRGEITILNRIQGDIKQLNSIRGEILKLNNIEGEIK